jgi:hypothetical protein
MRECFENLLTEAAAHQARRRSRVGCDVVSPYSSNTRCDRKKLLPQNPRSSPGSSAALRRRARGTTFFYPGERGRAKHCGTEFDRLPQCPLRLIGHGTGIRSGWDARINPSGEGTVARRSGSCNADGEQDEQLQHDHPGGRRLWGADRRGWQFMTSGRRNVMLAKVSRIVRRQFWRLIRQY